MKVNFFSGLGIILIALLCASSLLADTKQADSGAKTSANPSNDDKKAAKLAYDQGMSFFDSGEYGKAADFFRKAMSLAPMWKIYYNIGHSEAAAKHYGLALEAFQMYLAEAGDAIPDDREQEVIKQINELKNKVGSVKIKAPDGAEIFIDDIKRGTSPMAGSMKVSAGKSHTVVVKLESEIILEQPVRVWADDSVQIVAEKKSDEVTEPAPEPVVVVVESAGDDDGVENVPDEVTESTDDKDENADNSDNSDTVETSSEPSNIMDDSQSTPVRKHPLKITGAVLLTVGAIGLAGGAATGIVAIVKAASLDCPGNICTTKEDADNLDIAKKMGTASTIALSVGGGLAAAGIVLMIIGHKLEKKGAVALKATPVFYPGFGGMVIGGRF